MNTQLAQEEKDGCRCELLGHGDISIDFKIFLILCLTYLSLKQMIDNDLALSFFG